MADKTTGELRAVNIGDLPGSADIYDDFKMPGELQGEAVHVTGAQLKQYAVQAVKPIVKDLDEKVSSATNAGSAAQSALAGVREALSNLPEGSTLIVNDLTTGGTSAALSAEMGKVLGRRPNPNLLHNWYFVNTVNQRGKTSYATSGYSIDRWSINHSTATLDLSENGLVFADTVSGYISVAQKIENFERYAGMEMTLSILVSEVTGTVRCACRSGPSGSYQFDVKISEPGLHTVSGVIIDNPTQMIAYLSSLVANSAATITAVKLELGSAQTLAHQDASGQWVLNEIPDYGEELAKCQRYQVDIGGYYPVAVNSGGMSYTFFVQLPFDMRGTPNVDLSNAVITTPNVQADASGKLSLSDFRGRTMKIRFVPTVAPVTLGDAVLNIPAATIADANL